MFDLSHLPEANSRRIALHVKPSAERALRQGHPWLFDEGIRKQSHEGQAGDLAVIFDRHRDFLAIGLYDPASPIRVKVLKHHQAVIIDEAWFTDKITQAIGLRDGLEGHGTNGYRAIYGENDGLPALILDRYDATWVLKLYSSAWLPHLPMLVRILVERVMPEHLILRLSRHVQAEFMVYGLYDGQSLRGDAPEMPVMFRENGLIFGADVVHGHKTGYFFDQRDNRARVREMAEGRRVLDVFAYSGGFSVYAGAGGAREVTSLDVSAPALEQAQANMRLNAIHTGQVTHQIMVMDAFEGLQHLRDRGMRYDMVVVDPPSFAKRADDVDKALRAYERLAQLAIPLVAQDGHFVMASCSSRIGDDVFFNLVERALTSSYRKPEKVVYTHHAPDHPVSFPEGAYLKCLFAESCS